MLKGPKSAVLNRFFIVHVLSALDKYMDVYATLQKPGLCPYYREDCPTLMIRPSHNFDCRGDDFFWPIGEHDREITSTLEM